MSIASRLFLSSDKCENLCYIVFMEENDKGSKIEEGTKVDLKYAKTSMLVGKQFYGGTFERFMKVGEVKEFIAAFKDFYYQEKSKDPNARLAEILQNFNKEFCAPSGKKFHPYTAQVACWRAKWDLDLMQQLQDKELKIIERKNIHQLIKTRDDERNLVLGAPDDNSLEAGVRTLGGELLNDATQMLRDDQELEEIYDDETLIKRRNYIVNVFSHATKLVHGKAALMLKASAEKRDTAGFLMSLLARGTAGKMSDEEMNLLKSAYAPKLNSEAIKQNEPAAH